jgi:hypothetical protein
MDFVIKHCPVTIRQIVIGMVVIVVVTPAFRKTTSAHSFFVSEICLQDVLFHSQHGSGESFLIFPHYRGTLLSFQMLTSFSFFHSRAK